MEGPPRPKRGPVGTGRGGWPGRWRGTPRPRRTAGWWRRWSSPCGSFSTPVRETTTGSSRPSSAARATAAVIASASSSAGCGWAPYPRTRSSSSTPQVGSALSVAIRSRRRVGSIIGWARPWVRPSSPKSMTTWESLRRSAPRASSGDSGMLDRIGPRAAPATSIASSASVPPQNRPRSAPGTGPSGDVPGQLGHCGAGAPSADSAASVAAVRSGRPCPSVAQWTGLPSVAAYACTSASTSGAGGLDTTTIEVVAGSAARAASACRVERPRTAADRSRPPTPRQWLTPTPAASSRHMTCWAPVPEAATIPTEPARAALAKPSATPPTTAVPQSGPISSTSAAAAASLRAISSSTGTLSEKSITDSPAWTASRASTTALRPGTEMTARLASAAVAAEPMVRGGGASPKLPALAPAALRAARAASSASCPAFTAASSTPRMATSRSLGPTSSPSVKPMPVSRPVLSSVAMATSAASTPSVCPTARETCIRLTES